MPEAHNDTDIATTPAEVGEVDEVQPDGPRTAAFRMGALASEKVASRGLSPKERISYARTAVEVILGDEAMLPVLVLRDVATVFRYLQELGVSQRTIATLTEQKQSEISDILGGRKVVDVNLLERIFKGLGVPPGLVGLAYCDCKTCSRPSHRA